MKQSTSKQILAAVLLGSAVFAVHAEPARLVAPSTMQDVVSVEVTSIEGSVIKGRLVNRTDHRVQAPELMAKYDWLWNDDHHPGDNDPGWVTYAVVTDALAPNESRSFTIDPGRALPERNDGYFMTTVALTRVTEFMPAATE